MPELVNICHVNFMIYFILSSKKPSMKFPLVLYEFTSSTQHELQNVYCFCAEVELEAMIQFIASKLNWIVLPTLDLGTAPDFTIGLKVY